MKNITDADYKHGKRVWKDSEIKHSHEHYDSKQLHGMRYIILADIFENFRNKYIEIYKLNLAYFLSAWDLEWQAVLIKTEVGSDFSHVVICY